jgi:hypothetical protein
MHKKENNNNKNIIENLIEKKYSRKTQTIKRL